MRRLDGQVTIVTGAGRGIGKGIAECFIDQGATVIIATKEYEEGKLTEKELRDQGGNVAFIQTDITSEESIKNMIQETMRMFGKINTLVNNAGITLFKPLEEATISDWDKLINIDLRGPFLCSKYALPHMKKQKQGAIINISSNHAISTLPNSEIYAAAKGGINAMTKSMALSLGEHRIRVNSICPGFTDTPHYNQWLLEKENKDLISKEVKQLHALGRICTPKDIGKLAVYLSSDDSFMMTGENIVIDGGVSARLYNSEIC